MNAATVFKAVFSSFVTEKPYDSNNYQKSAEVSVAVFRALHDFARSATGSERQQQHCNATSHLVNAAAGKLTQRKSLGLEIWGSASFHTLLENPPKAGKDHHLIVPVAAHGAALVLTWDDILGTLGVQVVHPLLGAHAVASLRRSELTVGDAEEYQVLPRCVLETVGCPSHFVRKLSTIIKGAEESVAEGDRKGKANQVSSKLHRTATWLHAAVEKSVVLLTRAENEHKGSSAVEPLGGANDAGTHTGCAAPYLAWPLMRAAVAHVLKLRKGPLLSELQHLFLLFKAQVLVNAVSSGEVLDVASMLIAARVLAQEILSIFEGCTPVDDETGSVRAVDAVIALVGNWAQQKNPPCRPILPMKCPATSQSTSVRVSMPLQKPFEYTSTRLPNAKESRSPHMIAEASATLTDKNLEILVVQLEKDIPACNAMFLIEQFFFSFVASGKLEKIPRRLTAKASTIRSMTVALYRYSLLSKESCLPKPQVVSHRKLLFCCVASIAFELWQAKDDAAQRVRGTFRVPISRCVFDQFHRHFCTTDQLAAKAETVMMEYVAKHQEKEPICSIGYALPTKVVDVHATTIPDIKRSAKAYVLADAMILQAKKKEIDALRQRYDDLKAQGEMLEHIDCPRALCKGRKRCGLCRLENAQWKLKDQKVSVKNLHLSDSDASGVTRAFAEFAAMPENAVKWVLSTCCSVQAELSDAVANTFCRNVKTDPRSVTELDYALIQEDLRAKGEPRSWWQKGPNDFVRTITDTFVMRAVRHEDASFTTPMPMQDFTLCVAARGHEQLKYMLEAPVAADLRRENRVYTDAAGKLPMNILPEQLIALGNVRSNASSQILHVCEILEAHPHFDLAPGSVGFAVLLQTLIHRETWRQATKLVTVERLATFWTTMSNGFSKAADVQHMVLPFMFAATCPSHLWGAHEEKAVTSASRAALDAMALRILDFVAEVDADVNGGSTVERDAKYSRKRAYARQAFMCATGLLAFYDRPSVGFSANAWTTYAQLLLLWDNKRALAGTEVNDATEMLETISGLVHIAIARNWQGLTEAAQGNPRILNDAVVLLDKAMSDQLRARLRSLSSSPWRWEPTGPENREVLCARVAPNLHYSVDFLSGEVLKNGERIEGLPSQIRDSPLYKSIFGASDFEVSKVAHGSSVYRTLQDMRPVFFPEWSSRLSVYFEFDAASSTSPCVTMCVVDLQREEGRETRWIPHTNAADNHKSLTQLRLQGVPMHFFSHLSCWICRDETESLFLFCGQTLRTMCEAALLGRKKEGLGPVDDCTDVACEVFVIPEHLRLLDPWYILEEGLAKRLDQLCCGLPARGGHPWALGLEHPELQLLINSVTAPKGAMRTIWMPRLELYIDLFDRHDAGGDQQVVMQPRWRSEYIVAQDDAAAERVASVISPTDNSFSRMLVLRKKHNTTSPTSLLEHEIVVCLVDTEGDRDELAKASKTVLKLREFPLHDHFGDLRPSCREDALFLVAEYANCPTQLPLPWTEQTPMDLAVNLLRKCYSNVPFSQLELAHLRRACHSAQATPTLQLCCLMAWELSRASPWCAWGPSTTEARASLDCTEPLLNERQITIAHVAYCHLERSGALSYRQQLRVNERQRFGLSSEGGARSFHRAFTPCDSAPLTIAEDLRSIVEREESLIDALTVSEASLEDFDFPFDREPETPASALCVASQHGHTELWAQQSETEVQREFIKDLRRSWRAVRCRKLEGSTRASNAAESLNALLERCTLLADDAAKLRSRVCLWLLDAPTRGAKGSALYARAVKTMIAPIVSLADFTSCIFVDHTVKEALFPCMSATGLQNVSEAMHAFNVLSGIMDKAKRISAMIRSVRGVPDPAAAINLKGLLRELTSPRADINRHPFMAALEAELKIQVWKSQLDTFLLLDGKRGCVAQLNMGEGKTQVILPLLVLHSLLHHNKVPQLMLLGALLSEAHLNYERILTFSGFGFPVLQRPFHRDCTITQRDCARFDKVLDFFGGKAVVLLAREHHASLHLKCIGDAENRINWRSCYPMTTILDEVDELLSTDFRLVHSVNASQPLQSQAARTKLMTAALSVSARLAKDWTVLGIATNTLTAVNANSNEDTEDVFPDVHLRPDDEWPPEATEARFNELLFDALVSTVDFLQFLRGHVYEVRRFACDPSSTGISCASSWIRRQLETDASGPTLFLLRGLLAHGVLKHCLQLRFRVKYGKPSAQHVKRVAVPYLAANVPHPRSEFSHPDVSMMLTLLTYFREGLTFAEFCEAIRCFKALPPEAQELEYAQWTAHRSQLRRIVAKAAGIDLTSESQMTQLYNHLANAGAKPASRVSPALISFWLARCVFPSDLKHFPQSITASASDLTFGGDCVGFSGTRDNRWLLPLTVREVEHTNAAIEATDGEMLHMALRHTLAVIAVPAAAAAGPRWRALLLLALERKAAAVIDVGALLVGVQPLQMVEWLVDQREFASATTPAGAPFRGVSFFHCGKWAVFSCALRRVVDARRQIADSETFVIFDEARCRGADRLLHADCLALLTIAPGLTKDRFMQALGRLRKLGNNQKVIICGEERVLECAGVALKEPAAAPLTSAQPRASQAARSAVNLDRAMVALLHWLKRNTVTFVERSLINLAELSILHANPGVQHTSDDPEAMYNGTRQTRDVLDLLPWGRPVGAAAAGASAAADEEVDMITMPAPGAEGGTLRVPRRLIAHLNRYAAGVRLRKDALMGCAEREAEQEQEQEAEVVAERATFSLSPSRYSHEPRVLSLLSQSSAQLQKIRFALRPLCPRDFHPIISDHLIGTPNFFRVCEDVTKQLSRVGDTGVLLVGGVLCMLHPREVDDLLATSRISRDRFVNVCEWSDACRGRELLASFNAPTRLAVGRSLVFLRLYNGKVDLPQHLKPFTVLLLLEFATKTHLPKLSEALVYRLFDSRVFSPSVTFVHTLLNEQSCAASSFLHSELHRLCEQVDALFSAKDASALWLLMSEPPDNTATR